MAVSMLGAFAAGNAPLALLNASWLIEGGGGTVMLGSGNWVQIAGVTGADALNIPADVWSGLSVAEQQTALTGFLDAAVANNATIVFTSSPLAEGAGAGLQFEWAYLQKLGYVLVPLANGAFQAIMGSGH